MGNFERGNRMHLTFGSSIQDIVTQLSFAEIEEMLTALQERKMFLKSIELNADEKDCLLRGKKIDAVRNLYHPDALLGVRPIGPQDVIREADANYDLGRKHGRDEKADLLDWAETLLCNALPMAHCTQADWDDKVRRWRDEKHGVSTPKRQRTRNGSGGSG